MAEAIFREVGLSLVSHGQSLNSFPANLVSFFFWSLLQLLKLRKLVFYNPLFFRNQHTLLVPVWCVVSFFLSEFLCHQLTVWYHVASMASAVKTLLWVWVIGKSVVSLVTIPEITDESFIDECVRGHNRARSSVRPAASDMLYMVGLTHSFTSSTTNADRKAKSKLSLADFCVCVSFEHLVLVTFRQAVHNCLEKVVKKKKLCQPSLQFSFK